MYKPLTYIYNLSIKQSKIPDQLKISKVVPIHKKLNKKCVSNYRPVAVLPTFSKILEKIIYKRLITFIEDHKLLPDNQHGFRKNFSTESATISYINKICNALNQNKSVIGLNIDFSRAFDCINHAILFDKLDNIGVRGRTLDLFKDYFKNRKQTTFYKENYSDMKDLTTGVIQGSILGPILFCIYAADIVNSCNQIEFDSFADDTNGTLTGDNLETICITLINELENINRWVMANGMGINLTKTTYMIFTKSVPPISRIPIYIKKQYDFIPIERASTTKFLGVLIDERLKWDHHIKHVAIKLSKVCGIIYQIRKKITPEALYAIYYSLVYPHLIYCISVWGGTYKEHLTKVQIAQNKVIRAMSFTAWDQSVRQKMLDLKILNCTSIYKLNASMVVFKHLTKNYVPSLFNPIGHERNLRNIQHNLHVPFPHYTLIKKNLTFRIPNEWNLIPNGIKISPSINVFKRKMKLHLFSLQNNL